MRGPLVWLLLALLILALIVLLTSPSRYLQGGGEAVKVRVESGPVPASGNEAEPVRKKQR